MSARAQRSEPPATGPAKREGLAASIVAAVRIATRARDGDST